MPGPLVVDSSALMAIMLEEPDAIQYAEALYAATALRMSAPTWMESMQVVTGRRGTVGFNGLNDLLTRLDVEIVPCDAAQVKIAFNAWLAYGKGRHPAGLNFGDCFSYALAKQRGEPLLFKGDDFSKTDIVPAISSAE